MAFKKKCFLLFLLLLLCFLIYRFPSIKNHINCEVLKTLNKEHPALSVLCYLLLGTLGMLLFIPRTFFIVLGGVWFSAEMAMLWCTTITLLSSFLAYQFSRLSFFELLVKKAEKQKGMKQIHALSIKRPFIFSLFLRANHFFHFGASSYLCGVLKIPVTPFLWGTFWGTFPTTIFQMYAIEQIGCVILKNYSFPDEIKNKIILFSIILSIVTFLPLLIAYREMSFGMNKDKKD